MDMDTIKALAKINQKEQEYVEWLKDMFSYYPDDWLEHVGNWDLDKAKECAELLGDHVRSMASGWEDAFTAPPLPLQKIIDRAKEFIGAVEDWDYAVEGMKKCLAGENPYKLLPYWWECMKDAKSRATITLDGLCH